MGRCSNQLSNPIRAAKALICQWVSCLLLAIILCLLKLSVSRVPTYHHGCQDTLCWYAIHWKLHKCIQLLWICEMGNTVRINEELEKLMNFFIYLVNNGTRPSQVYYSSRSRIFPQFPSSCAWFLTLTQFFQLDLTLTLHSPHNTSILYFPPYCMDFKICGFLVLVPQLKSFCLISIWYQSFEICWASTRQTS